jgi:hypothetical protein
MKRALIAGLTIAALGLAANCLAAGHACPDGECSDCKPGLFHRCTGWLHSKQCDTCGKKCGLFHKCGGLLNHHARRNEVIEYGGPPAAQVTYPYYTNRGPRDFLDPNPRGIGP